MLTLEEAKRYLKVDFEDDDEDIQSFIEVSEAYIDSMVGVTYKLDERAVKLANLLQKKLVNDMYENRSTEILSNTKQDRIVSSILDKLSNYTDG
ncbi:head-tail connector protein [Clostridium intestinale]|uniref:head-tail connector protein n=1 Tax=Clostridium intestinale TaxID=36845 RepID=UPI0028EB48E2|nr:head-tail connector protein [Clostridium intestinale]